VERSVAGVVLATFDGDPAGALQAALSARARLEELFGDDVRVRIAIEAGEVLTAGGSSSGPPVAAAALLVGGAGPGDVLLGKRAAEAIQAGFDLRPRQGGYLLVGPR
jgi:class 3 adenylate cyclase